MLKIETQSFAPTELKLLGLVRDKSLVDVSRLPSPEYVKELYMLDENTTPSRISDIIKGYEMKIDLFARWQKGENLNELIVNKYHPSKSNGLGDIFV